MKINIRSIKISENKIIGMIDKKSKKLSKSVVSDLKSTAPKDDTTKSKAKYIYKRTGKRAWIKDDIESRKYWTVNPKRVVKDGKVTLTLENPNPAVVALALGFISPLNLTAKSVERIPNGLFSEQDPKGIYALESIKRAMIKNGYINVKITDIL